MYLIWYLVNLSSEYVLTGCAVHPSTDLVGTGDFSPGKGGGSGRGMNLTTELHLVPRLRMCGASYTSTPPIRLHGVGEVISMF